jgi:serine protease AprX
MVFERATLERFVYGAAGLHRYTQDSPVLADVWFAYGENGGVRQDLILTPRFGSNAAKVALGLRQAVADEPSASDRPSIVYNQVYVAARLDFRELVREVLPMTRWWQKLWIDTAAAVVTDATNYSTIDGLLHGLGNEVLAEMTELRNLSDPAYIHNELPETQSHVLPGDLAWFVRLVGLISLSEPNAEPGAFEPVVIENQLFERAVEIFVNLPLPEPGTIADDDEDVIWLVNINRTVRAAVTRSRLAVKADAAQRLFDIRTNDLTWAILDSGIDASHPAFGSPPVNNDRSARPWWETTRVTATYDFTRIRELLDPVSMNNPETLSPEVRQVVDAADGNVIEGVRESIAYGRAIDWALFKPLLRVPHDDNYRAPRNAHGTHVAGILAANYPEQQIIGMCPDIKLYDLRVLKPGPDNDEFTVLAALQFISWLNSQKDFFAVHGANLSLSIRHDVANFACGRTPICDQCEDLVASGVVVVAAAGNEGYLRYRTTDGYRDTITEGYHTMSISDPGNARTVITVGSTHRDSPHTYGVSYFSSRGPTGDGRSKPDIVAPGEKIESVVPGNGVRRMDGTSMSAPHVSGACAMLMARHAELIGDPGRIKQAICATATDLGRERYFQGAGMLDVLRALQSI